MEIKKTAAAGFFIEPHAASKRKIAAGA